MVLENFGVCFIVWMNVVVDDQCFVFDVDFFEEVLRLVNNWMLQVCSKILFEWLRRLIKFDGDGRVCYLLWDCDFDIWFCLYCYGKIMGVQIVENLWYCFVCGVVLVDIFDIVFWCEDEGKLFLLIGVKVKLDISKFEFYVVDDCLKFELNECNIVFFMRSVFLDDVMNVSE